MTDPADTQTARRARRTRVRGFAALAATIFALLGAALPAAAQSVTPADGATPPATPASPTSPPATDEPEEPHDPLTVLVGVAGLRWTDVNPSSSPHLWRMIGSSSVASINVRTVHPVTCPLDAWLTLSAGRRVSGPIPPEAIGSDGADGAAPSTPTDGPADGPQAADCLPLPSIASGSSVAPTTIPGWTELTTDPENPLRAEGVPGALGAAFASAGTCTTAIGAGAAVTLADAGGRVGRYAASLDEVSDDELKTCDIVVIDQGQLPVATTDRNRALGELDEVLERLTDDLPEGSRVLVAGIADTPGVRPGLQVVIDWRASGNGHGWLASESTRYEGFVQGVVQLTDLTATLATDADLETTEFDGAVIEPGEERRMSIARTVENRRYLGVLTTTAPSLMPLFVGLLIGVQILVFGGMLLARRLAARRAASGTTPGSARPDPALPPSRRGRRLVAATALLAASAPVAASLGTLSRWWVWPAPTFALTLAVSVATVVVALLSWLISRALPRHPWRLAAAVSGVTWLVLTIDGLTGTTMQQGSLLGPAPVLGARFYGFNNTTFAIYAVAGLILAGSVASMLSVRGRRRAAIGVVIAVGAVTTLIDGWPAFGADFGGILALVPGFTILALSIAHVRITPRRIAALAAATIATVAVVAVLDWLAPGSGSHLGGFVQRIIDGDALGIVGSKAAGTWATVASVPGAVGALAFAAAAWAALRPNRFHLPEVTAAYREWPLLRPIVIALLVMAVVGSVLNDSGVVIAVVFLVATVATIVASFLAEPAEPTARPGRRRGGATIVSMPSTVVSLGGGMLIALLLAASLVPPPSDTGVAGNEVRGGTGAAVAAEGSDIVVIGTAGLRWTDVADGNAPTLGTLLTDGAGTAGSAMPTGAAGNCPDTGWLSLSAGKLPQLALTPDPEGRALCPTIGVEPSSGGADVDGWADLSAQQAGGSPEAELGTLGDALAAGGACATAVGPRAALALADSDGRVERYRDLDAALDPNGARDATGSREAFACGVTVVDAGDATPAALGDLANLTAEERQALYDSSRADLVADVDATVRRVLDVVPPSATVLVVDLSNAAGSRAALGVTLVRPSSTVSERARFLTSAATRSDGVVRVLDVPSTILTAAEVEQPEAIDDTPVSFGSLRSLDTVSVSDELADLTTRDHVRRIVYPYFVDYLGYVGLALAVGCLVLGARRRPSPRWDRIRRLAEGAALFLASMPAASFLVSLTNWWRFANPMLAIALVTVGVTAIVAALGALAPRRPVWAAPGIVAGITFGVLVFDALIGAPLNRASPLGSAPTFGARFYGFGNPTFSVFAVVAVIAAAALAQWLVARGRRRTAALSVAAIGAVAMVIDVWPTLGADLGGGLVLVPTFAIIGLAASGVRLTVRRFVLVGAIGVGAVAAIGVLDWLRPETQRSHLGRFVGQVIDGQAWETLWRKAGFALRSVLGGVPVWITILVLVWAGFVLFGRRRFTPAWFARTEEAWPLFRPAMLAIWVMCVSGSLVNDFGVRIAMIALVAAVPLVTSAALRATWAARAGASSGTGAELERVGSGAGT